MAKAKRPSYESGRPQNGSQLTWLADDTAPPEWRGKLLQGGVICDGPRGLAVVFFPPERGGVRPVVLIADRPALAAAVDSELAREAEAEAARRARDAELDAIPEADYFDVDLPRGQAFRARDGSYWTVVGWKRVRVWDDFEDEWGWGTRSGCRPATEAERAECDARFERAAARKAARAELDALAQHFRSAGEYPDGSNVPEGEEIPAGGGERIYGGGRWFVLGPEWIWFVQNNGHDGDDWSYNNVRTGGAGAIGRRVPAMAELAERIRRAARIAGSEEAS